MIPIAIQAMQWEVIPELHETPEIDLSDLECMDEVRAVLSRHGKLSRFALHLVHKHIELADDEVLVERPDPVTRTQHVTVERLEDIPNARPTTWIFTEEGEQKVHCACETVTQGYGGCLWHSKHTEAIMEKRSRLREIERREISRIDHNKRFPNIDRGRSR